MRLKFTTLLILMILFSSCAGQKADVVKSEKPGSFAHVVYFWLKHPYSATEKTAFLQSLEKFIHQSPYISTYHIGVPSVKERDVVDDSYTFSLVTTFKDKATHDKYQIEPAHQTLRDEIGVLIEKIIVYDSDSTLIN